MEDEILVFVDVVNLGNSELELSSLEYRLDGAGWNETRGRLKLARTVEPGASAIVEIPVELLETQGGGHGFRLRGTLYARDGALERSWVVSARGDVGAQVRQRRDIRVAAIR